MAHFKRGYPHTVWRTGPARISITPSGWNTLHYSRPRRRLNARLAHAIKSGRDPEEVVWPVEKRPHHYYW